MLSSTLSLPTLTLPAYWSARSSMIGPTTRHGMHHGAQKSTRTRPLPASLVKFSSVNSIRFSMISPMRAKCAVVASLELFRECRGGGLGSFARDAINLRSALDPPMSHARHSHPQRASQCGGALEARAPGDEGAAA